MIKKSLKALIASLTLEGVNGLSRGDRKLILGYNTWISIFKGSSNSYFRIKGRVPRDHWLAISYGGSHVDSDMFIFVAKTIIHDDKTYAATFFECVPQGYKPMEIGDCTNNVDSSGFNYYSDDFDEYTDYFEFEAERKLDLGSDKFKLEFDTPIRIGYAIGGHAAREHIHEDDIDLNDPNKLVEEYQFGNHYRYGYFEIVLDSGS